MFEELLCPICQSQFSNEGDYLPRLLPESGHTISTKCLNEELQKAPDQPFQCPVSGIEVTRKASAEDYPRNFALIRLVEKTKERQRQEAEELEKKQ